MKKMWLCVALLLVSGSVWASEGCDIAAKYAGLGFMDAKNGTPEKNRIEEIDSRIENKYRDAALAGMRLGRSIFNMDPNRNQGDVENEMRRDCSF